MSDSQIQVFQTNQTEGGAKFQLGKIKSKCIIVDLMTYAWSSRELVMFYLYSSKR
jgi:hypothetical protein